MVHNAAPTDLQQVAEDISSTIDSQDRTIILDDGSPSQPPAPTPPPKPDQNEDKSDSQPKKVAGYVAADILDAPVKPPVPVETEGRDLTENKKVILIIGAALLLFVIGLLVAVVGQVWLGLALIVVAAIGVALAVFLPIH